MFPIGSVLAKEFWLGSHRVETRLLVRHEDGDWAGYTYLWREDGSEADVVPLSAAPVRTWDGQSWYYPRRTECLGCHTSAVGRSIGLTVPQLDREVAYPNGRVADQLATLTHLGVLDPSPVKLPAVPDIRDDSAPLGNRARAWLHANAPAVTVRA